MNGTWDQGGSHLFKTIREDFGSNDPPHGWRPEAHLSRVEGVGCFEWSLRVVRCALRAGEDTSAFWGDLEWEGMQHYPGARERRYEDDEEARDAAVAWVAAMTLRGVFIPAGRVYGPT